MDLLNKKLIKNRIVSIEILRFIACCGIVWFHVGAPGKQFAYAGLPIFMILTISFAFNSDSSFPLQIKRYARRLITPWIFWSFIYAISKISLSVISGTEIHKKFHYWMLLTGTSLHLWYLPYVFLNIIVIGLIKSYVKKKIIFNFYLLYPLLAGLLILIISNFFYNIPYIIPFNQWLFLIPSFPMGLFFVSLIFNFPQRKFFLIGIVFVIVSCLIALVLDWKGLAIPYIVAIIACYIFISFKKTTNRIFLKLGEISYGIYLVHVILISLFQRLGIAGKSVEMVIVTLVSSIVITIAILKTPFKKFI